MSNHRLPGEKLNNQASPNAESLPAGLELHLRMLEFLTGWLPRLEEPQREVAEDWIAQIVANGESEYPDHDWSQWDDKPPKEMSRDERVEFCDEVVDHYRQRPDDYGDARLDKSMKRDHRDLVLEELQKPHHAKAINDAAGLCGYLATMVDGYCLTRSEKSACKSAARALDTAVGAAEAAKKRGKI
jgi:hypothetical protein